MMILAFILAALTFLTIVQPWQSIVLALRLGVANANAIPVMTLSRLTGSGGAAIGHRLAKRADTFLNTLILEALKLLPTAQGATPSQVKGPQG